jgi:ubiquinone biosynthesis protein
LRVACVLLWNAADQALGALGDLLWPARQRPARREQRAIRLARRLARTLGDLKGAFAKAGQFAATRQDLLPAPALEALARLRDRVPPLPLAALRGLLERELDGPLEERFASFEEEPLGAASVAQAHRATLPDGSPVVVKVQYPWLEASLAADVALLRRLLGLAVRFARRPPPDAARIFEEFAGGLAEELDFEREARVAGEIAANLAADPRVVVPRVVPTHSTRRVLTMRWHPAVPVLDRAGLLRLGVAPAEVLEILARAYAQQVFVDGLFHADPHPGNLFVIDEPEAARRPRVLFVDFGLSKRLEPELRREMRLAIYALLQADPQRFLAGMERTGMIAPGARPQVEAAVTRMLGRLRGEGAGSLQLGGRRVLALKDEAKVLLRETPGLQLPNDLLLYAKTLSYLFALGEELDPDVDLMKLSVPYLLQFLASKD